MSRRRHTQAHFPALDPHEALRFVGLLQRVIDAVWRAHGQEMGERLIDQYVAELTDDGPPIDDREVPF